MNSLLAFHGHAVPAPVEIITATINLSPQMNYYMYISAEWKVTISVHYKSFCVIYSFQINTQVTFACVHTKHNTEFLFTRHSTSVILHCVSQCDQ